MNEGRIPTRRAFLLARALLLGLVGAIGIACATASHRSAGADGDGFAGDPIRSEVRRLSADDFRVRTTAARSLVDRGAAAVPALGEAADGSDEVALRAVLEQIQMQLPSAGLQRCLASSHASVRESACRVAADRRLDGLIRPMIPLLRDDDGAVRSVALTSLRRLTRRFEGRTAEDFEGDLSRRARR
jgi:hypothetical protein